MQDFGSNKEFVQLDMNFEQGTSSSVELLLRVNLAQFWCNEDGAIMPLDYVGRRIHQTLAVFQLCEAGDIEDRQEFYFGKSEFRRRELQSEILTVNQRGSHGVWYA
ncbi:hypothetical protein MIR68_009278 [Amoeboaphelidium protococcarum]|nr:hypothetical protein MIR68_009278 [Amoeboaphelidium protococcarum]